MEKLKYYIIKEVTACNDRETLELVEQLLLSPKRPAAQASRRTAKYEGFGEEHTNVEWARRLGLPRNTVWRHLQNGRTIEQIAELRGIEYLPNNSI